VAAYIRKARTASGATAVQIATKNRGRHKIRARRFRPHRRRVGGVAADRPRELEGRSAELDLGLDGGDRGSVIVAKRSRWLIEARWRRLGFDVIDDDAFFQLALGRIVEPTSMIDTSRVADEIGLTSAHRNTFVNVLNVAPQKITGAR